MLSNKDIVKKKISSAEKSYLRLFFNRLCGIFSDNYLKRFLFSDSDIWPSVDLPTNGQTFK